MPTLQSKRNSHRIREILRAIGGQIRRCARVLTRRGADEFDRPERAGAFHSALYRCETIRHRLMEGVVSLERLDAERELRGDSRFGKTLEDRIIWDQLIDLELEEIDEQLGRIRRSAGRDTPAGPQDSGSRIG